MDMSLDQLIERLQEIQRDLQDSDTDTSEIKVLVGIQPSYPLVCEITDIVFGEELDNPSKEDVDVVWIGTDQIGGHADRSPYAPKEIWEE